MKDSVTLYKFKCSFAVESSIENKQQTTIVLSYKHFSIYMIYALYFSDKNIFVTAVKISSY